MKSCTSCRRMLPLAEFHRRSKAKDGLGVDCKECNARRAREWRLANPERVAAYHRARRLRRYQLTLDDFQSMVDRQGGRCAVCRSADAGGKSGQWHVDHDHSCCPGPTTCGRCVRGLLCNRCNSTVIPILEDRQIVEAGLAYLSRLQVS